MLENVKLAIAKANDGVPFEAFFNAYIMSIQDANIVSEVMNEVKHHSSVIDIERLAQQDYRKLVK